MAALVSKPGITRLSTSTGVPKEWSQSWFRDFISDHLKLADARNAIEGNGISITGNITGYATIGLSGTMTGQIVINPTPGKQTLVVNGAANQFAESIRGNATSGQSYGLQVAAGTNGSDIALQIRSQDNTVDFLTIHGDGSGFIGPNITNDLSWSAAGNFILSAPTSGIALVSTGLSGLLTPAIRAAGTDYQFQLYNSSGAANEKYTSFRAVAHEFLISFVNDAGTANTNPIDITRSGITATAININATTLGVFSAVGAAQSTGWGTPTGNSKVANFPGGGPATLAQCSNVIAQIITDLKSWGFYAA